MTGPQAPPGPTAARHRRRQPLAVPLLAAVLFLAVWIPLQPERNQPPTSDLYTQLTVARHLARGDGFLTDVAYPLSFAFPFARSLPQPLIHRMPGYAVLLTVPYLAGGGDPVRVLVAVRWLQYLLLGFVIAAGVLGLRRSGAQRGIGVWLILLGTSPLLGFAAAWGQDEILAAALLLSVWLVLRLEANERPRLIGILTGLTALVRLELLWVPVLWWLMLRGRGPRFWLMLAAALVILAPWSLRNLRVTGQPFFTLQGVAEFAKDTRTFPEYTVYRGLSPQSLLHSLRDDPEPLARKTARGLRFFPDNLPRFLPWPWLVVLAASPLLRVRRGKTPGIADQKSLRPTGSALPEAVGTLALLIVFYAPFDHDLRHLIVVLPLLTWELSLAAARLAARCERPGGIVAGAGLAAAALAVSLLFAWGVPGWEAAAADAARLRPSVAKAVIAAREGPAGVIFVEYSAVPWYADRPGVWSPLDPQVAARIAGMLASDPAPRP